MLATQNITARSGKHCRARGKPQLPNIHRAKVLLSHAANPHALEILRSRHHFVKPRLSMR